LYPTSKQPAGQPLTSDQFALIGTANYGVSESRTRAPQAASNTSNAYTIVSSGVLDYQFNWFPKRKDAPSLNLEFSSGLQVNTQRVDTHHTTSSSRQLTYVNICTLTYSVVNHVSLTAGAEWDAPIYSDPLRGSIPYYANIAVFSAGISYDLYLRANSTKHWTFSATYSYTAFDPLNEINQLQVLASFSF
jgi:hypothetical protein